MKKILSIVFLLCVNYLFAQNTIDSTANDVAPIEKIYMVVENPPEFPGGDAGLIKYLQKNIKYPEEAEKNNIQGRVYVQFVIDKEGNVRDVKIIRGAWEELNEEALRVVSQMPQWKPGRQNGRRVSVMFNLPINFSL